MPRGRGAAKLLWFLIPLIWPAAVVFLQAAWGVVLIVIGLVVVGILTYHIIRFWKALVAMICVAFAAKLFLVAPDLWPLSLILGAAPICYVLYAVVATKRESRVVSR